MTFTLVETHNLTDIHSVGKLYQHPETGAQVLYLENDDTNKAFTIAFKTPPYDDNGIAHIIEHSVLNGSRKFPSKEPFVELIKGSLNTFVNAMTYPDKTVYPVASTNLKDFTNMMDVYLDAVFHPLLHENPQILAQEGWHYHLEKAEDDLIYKGVVYNEMKGATASGDQQLYNAIQRYLYAGTPYEHESGGLPSAIPTLTQDAFTEFHTKYYHPSNSLTVLYGDLDIDAALNMLDGYFSGKGKQEALVDLSVQATQPEQATQHLTYSITEGDDPTNKDIIASAWHVSDATSSLDDYGLKILSEVLFGNNQAPLKKALLDAEIGGDITGGHMQVGYPTAFLISAKYSQVAHLDKFKTVIDATLMDLVNNGINKDLINAALNKISFALKESVISESNPRGVLYGLTALQSWLYDLSPYDRLAFSDKLETLEKLAQGDYFEQLIQSKLLDNPLRVDITLQAEPGKNDRAEAQLFDELQAYKNSLSQEAIDDLVASTQSLIQRQETPDSAQDLAKIPTLNRDDLTTETADYPLHNLELDEDFRLFHAPQFTAGIDYVDMFIDISDFSEDDILWASYLSQLLGSLPTAHYSAADLQTQIDTHTGGINAGVVAYQSKEGDVRPYMTLRGKALSHSLTTLIALMKEILVFTDFSDTKELLNLTQELYSEYEDTINYGAHMLASSRALSQVRSIFRLGDLMNGVEQIFFTKERIKELENGNSATITARLEQLLKRLTNTLRYNVLYIGEEERVQEVKGALTTTFADLSSEDLADTIDYQPATKVKEAFLTAQDVNYVGFAADASASLPYNGPSVVAKNFISYEFLWNNIRVKGGAYGSLFRQSREGGLTLASYRDPNIGKTLSTYNQLADYIRNLKTDEAGLLKGIIGSLSDLDQPLSAYQRGNRAFNQYISGYTTQDTIQLKEEILATTIEDIQALADKYHDAMADGTIVVIGNKAQIEEERDLFDVVHELY